jgi:hypothetical protein
MRMGFRFWLLIAGLLFLPSAALAQTSVPPVLFTGPLSNPRPEEGGIYTGFNFVYMNTNRTLGAQTIAYRGFLDRDGQASGTGLANTWVGSKDVALNTEYLLGPGLNQPGWDLYAGWKFSGGVAVELGWRHLVQAKYSASAAIIPPDNKTGLNFENTFMTSLVTNFSTDWAGADPRLPTGTIASVFGIWDAASLMQIDYIQRYDIYEINVRIPVYETDCWRTYGLLGPRIVWIWERFHWRTVSADVNGNTAPDTIADYYNMVSNRMTGVHAGCGNDWFLGNTPIGAFACNFDIEGGLYLDFCKTDVQYQREDRVISSSRGGRLFALSPGVNMSLGLKWYCWEGITVDLGWDLQTYFNTYASLHPVDFNLSTVNPTFDHIFFRYYTGLRFGVTFSF